MLIKAMLVDDEQPSLNKLEKLIGDSGLAEVVAKFTDPLKALEFIQDTEIDVVFLDIEMPDVDGIELAGRILDLNRRTDIVFVTAYNQYAVEAFRLNALDYLLKPVSSDRLKDSLQRIIRSRPIAKQYGTEESGQQKTDSHDNSDMQNRTEGSWQKKTGSHDSSDVQYRAQGTGQQNIDSHGTSDAEFRTQASHGTLENLQKDESCQASKTSRILKIQCFGKFRVYAGTEEIKFRTEKAEELLALLLDSRGDFVSRSRIIDDLWEDFDGDRAMIHFNTTLHYIKKALLPYGIRLSIIFDRGSYKLDVDDLDCDYLNFCAFTTGAEANPPASISEYEHIAALYTGEYLSGRDYDWAAGRRLCLLEQYISLLFTIEKHYSNAENYPMAIKWLKEGLLLEPLHRELNYRLVKLLLLTHERILAYKHYELYKKGLAKKLGIEPDSEFMRLFSER